MRTRTLLPLLLIGLIGAWAGAAWDSSWTAPSRKMTETRANVPPAQRDEDDAASGCPDAAEFRAETGPAERGPMRLERAYCIPFRSHDSGIPLVSPDGRAVAHWGHGREPVLEAMALDGTAGFRFANRLSLRTFTLAGPPGYGGFAWARDSQTLWTIHQASVNPSGFALGPLQPVRVTRDGRVLTLPPLRHPAGPLDAIEWIGGHGLALAQFGTRGGYYRPEHEDPAPTLAMVDVRRGRVLAALPVLGVPAISDRVRAWGLHPTAVTGVVLPDGRLRAVVQFPPWSDVRARTGAADPPLRPARWLVWTQGEAPRLVPVPESAARSRIALTPDGRQLLVTQSVEARGIIMEHRPSPPPEPVTGNAAELFDVASGRRLWRIEARAERMWSGPATASAISPDGRHAIVVLPPGPDSYTNYALVELRTGRVVQHVRPFLTSTYAQSFGFTADGRRLWFASGNIVILYRRAPR